MVGNDFDINLFNDLFKGRDDVFAKRWETKDKSGYAPAYDIDWNQYSVHKASGGTLKDYPHKSYGKLTDTAIIAHLEGKDVIGIYPLLGNNTSWFVAVDFDENDWRTEIIRLFITAANVNCRHILNDPVQVMAVTYGYFLSSHTRP